MSNKIQITEIDFSNGHIYGRTELPVTITKEEDTSNERILVFHHHNGEKKESLCAISFTLDENGDIHDIFFKEDLNHIYKEKLRKNGK